MTEEAFLALDDAEETDLEYYDGAAWRKGLVDRNHRGRAGKLMAELHDRAALRTA
jgi:hypothetical protein